MLFKVKIHIELSKIVVYFGFCTFVVFDKHIGKLRERICLFLMIAFGFYFGHHSSLLSIFEKIMELSIIDPHLAILHPEANHDAVSIDIIDIVQIDIQKAE